MPSPLFVDTQAGSKELIEPLKRLRLDVVPTRLDSGDLMFEGRGVKGAPVLVGIEYKKLSELVESFRTERLQGFQVPRMRETYQWSYLFIEGSLLYNAKGRLCAWKNYRGHRQLVPCHGQMTVGELLRRLYVLHLCAGVVPWWTRDQRDTLQSISALYHTWTDVDLDEHKSHLALYVPPAPFGASRQRITLSTFPDVGKQFSRVAEKTFQRSIAAASTAPIEEWAALTATARNGSTRRLGMKAAQRIVNFCHGQEE